MVIEIERSMEPSNSFREMFVACSCPCCGGNAKTCFPIDSDYASQMSGIPLKHVDIGVAVCSDCTHEYINPVPDERFLKAFYSNYMSSAKSGFYRERSADDIPLCFRVRYEPWLMILKSLVGERCSLLDVGAGLGMFLRLAREHGFKVQGVEPSLDAAVALQANHHITVINSFFEQVELHDKVDVVSMWDLLEHLANPRYALGKAAGLLNADGILVLEIPARDSLLHDLAKVLYRISAGRIRRPLYLVCGVHHLHYFSQVGISGLLEECGFKVKQVHRGETELESLYRGRQGKRSAAELAYNASLTLIFWLARQLGRQNKLIVFAQRVSG
jgi:2-polyprenyl-3-methyl-5-hydroxy-6-metoxy-1,4-benzoquinol methylase